MKTSILRARRKDRLEVLEEWLNSGTLVYWRRAPEVLHESGLVSVNYGMSNLYMDIWYLRRPYLSPDVKSMEEAECDSGKILFHVIMRSLLDFRSGRPCDSGIWNDDMSSDFSSCTSDHHLCSGDAERFLKTLDPEVEEFCNLSRGKIRDLLKSIKKDPIFQIGSILDSEEPTSFVALRISSLQL